MMAGCSGVIHPIPGARHWQQREDLMKSTILVLAGSVFLSACASPLLVGAPPPPAPLTQPMTFNKYMPPENKRNQATSPRKARPTGQPARKVRRKPSPGGTPGARPGTPVVYESPCVRNGVRKFEKTHGGRSPSTAEFNQIERDCRD